MIVGTIAYGPLDRVLGTRKWVVFGGNMITVALLAALVTWIGADPWLSIALMSAIGFFGATFPVIIAHARSFFPVHLTGRGVTLMNLFGIGGVGVMQTISGRIHTATAGGDPTAPYTAILGFFAIALALGVMLYAFTRDSRD
ncbi:MAG: MFS transporter, partial [Pseudomonadota bacterium]